jgi:hypothetical protein
MDSLRLHMVSSGETQIFSQTKHKLRKLSLSNARNSMRFSLRDRRTKKAKNSKGRKKKKLEKLKKQNKKMKKKFSLKRRKLKQLLSLLKRLIVLPQKLQNHRQLPMELMQLNLLAKRKKIIPQLLFVRIIIFYFDI